MRPTVSLLSQISCPRANSTFPTPNMFAFLACVVSVLAPPHGGITAHSETANWPVPLLTLGQTTQVLTLLPPQCFTLVLLLYLL